MKIVFNHLSITAHINLIESKFVSTYKLELITPLCFHFDRHCLWILGNAETLKQSRSVWKKLVNDAKQRGCFHNADDDKNLAQAIKDAMLELELVDEFKSPFMSLTIKDKKVKLEKGSTSSRYNSLDS